MAPGGAEAHPGAFVHVHRSILPVGPEKACKVGLEEGWFLSQWQGKERPVDLGLLTVSVEAGQNFWL